MGFVIVFPAGYCKTSAENRNRNMEKKMEKIRMGVVGLGHRGRNMFKLAAEAFPDQVIPAAACDLIAANWTDTKFQQTRPMCDILPETKFYTDFQTMLKEAALDAILIETGADVHAYFCAEALKADIHVLSDIPVVATIEEADMLWKVHKESKAIFSTGSNPNYARYTVMMQELYKKGYLGKPYYMEAEYIHCSIYSEASKELTVHSPWRKTLTPIRYCTHSLGPLLRIIEEDLRYAICLGTGNHFEDDSNKHNMMAALFQTESGVTIRLLRNGKCRAAIGHHSYRVFGTKGYYERLDSRGEKYPAVTRFRSDELYGAHDLTVLPAGMMAKEYMYNPKAAGHGGADYALLDHMFKSYLNQDAEYPISLRDGLRMTLPGIYAEESARRNGEKIRMTYPWDPDWTAEF